MDEKYIRLSLYNISYSFDCKKNHKLIDQLLKIYILFFFLTDTEKVWGFYAYYYRENSFFPSHILHVNVWDIVLLYEGYL